MTPGARVQAAIEILDQIATGIAAEKALTGWARRSRFAGSKDRAAVRDHVFDVLRCKRSFACLGGGESGRALMLGRVRADGTDPDDLFTGQGHAPHPLSAAERTAGHAPGSEGDRLDLPDWLVPLFHASLGDGTAAAAEALRRRAPVVVRVNARISNASQAIDILQEDGISAEPVEEVETALALRDGARRLNGARAYAEGVVELQDTSSQAAMACLPVRPGQRVLDYCAGGGGKVLALAARAEAQWFAHDADPGRMRDLPARARRAGVTVTRLSPEEVQAEAPFDLVLCDVPCSGSGTWRRAPEAKWRLTPERLAALKTTQADILVRASDLVGPHGHLAYTTCSVLEEENGDRVAGFIDSHPDWQLREERRWPISEQGDGFYLALFQRR